MWSDLLAKNVLAVWCNVSDGHSHLTKQGLQLKNQRHKRLMGDKDNSLNNNDNI